MSSFFLGTLINDGERFASGSGTHQFIGEA
jgi:hypothetical protein